MRNIAENAILRYAQGILTVDSLFECMAQERERWCKGRDEASEDVLKRIAQRICSRELCLSWRSSDVKRRNYAFENIRHHLEYSLQHTHYALELRNYAHATEDLLHQVLEMFHVMLKREDRAGPDDPAAFLKWTQTILFRQAYTFLQKCRREAHLSLDAQPEIYHDQFVDRNNKDPLEHVLLDELQQTLRKAILSVHNPRYRDVLLYTYVVGVDEREIASRLHVQVQDIYLWHHRALKSLRKEPEIMKALHTFLE